MLQYPQQDYFFFPHESETHLSKKKIIKRHRDYKTEEEDEGRTGRGEGASERNKDRGKQIEGAREWEGIRKTEIIAREKKKTERS